MKRKLLILCINDGRIYQTAAAAAAAAGVSAACMSRHLKGDLKTVKRKCYVLIDERCTPDQIEDVRKSELNRIYGIAAMEVYDYE